MGAVKIILISLIILVSILVLMSELDRNYSYTQEIYTYYSTGQYGVGIYNTLLRVITFNDMQQSGKHILPLDLFPKHKILENNWKIFAKEAKNAYHNNHLTNFSTLHPVFTRIADSKWKTLVLKWYDKPIKNNCYILCPQTCKIINSIPEIKAAMFSILESNNYIPPHRGPFKGCLRYHLGLDIPQGDCYIKINGEKYFWQNGKSFLFDDTYEHEVHNNTNNIRIILFIDVLRPLPGLFNKINEIVCNNAKFTSFVNNINAKAEIVKQK